MIRVLLAFVVWVSVVGPLAAKELTVRSGEHGSFTRLVIRVPEGTSWSLAAHAQGANLSVNITDVTFATQRVFQRLSDGRLLSLGQKRPGGGLEMEFGCACVARAFLHDDTMIVVDISSGEPEITELPEHAQSDPGQTPTPNLDTNQIEWIPGQDILPPLHELSGQRIEHRLMSRFLQGADRQAIDLKLAAVGPRRTSTLEPAPNLLTDPVPFNMSVSSVYDERFGRPDIEIPLLGSEQNCITNYELNFESWGGEGSFSDQVANLRSGLYQEFDRLNEGNAIRLAKLYAYFGFGFEAGQLVSLIDNPTDETSRIQAIARAAENGPQQRDNPFSGLQGCVGDAALWAVLTDRSLEKGIDSGEIERAFARLPDHLRRHYGSVLSDILLEANKPEAARRILRSVDRIEDENEPEYGLAKAGIAAIEGNPAQEESILLEVIAEPAAEIEAPLAMVRLIEKRLTERGAVSATELDLISAYALQFRRSEIGPAVRMSHILALALHQEFDEAVLQLGKIRLDVPAPAWGKTHDQTMMLLAERSDDIAFLRYGVNMTSGDLNTLSVETATAISDRLVSLGFAARAIAFSDRPQDRAMRAARAEIRAKAALLSRRPHQALLEIAENESVSSLRLRARALAQAGDFAAAAELLDVLGASEDAERYWWLAGAVPDTDRKNVGKFGSIAAMTDDLSNTVEWQPETPLSSSTDILRDSSQAREVIANMLDALS